MPSCSSRLEFCWLCDLLSTQEGGESDTVISEVIRRPQLPPPIAMQEVGLRWACRSGKKPKLGDHTVREWSPARPHCSCYLSWGMVPNNGGWRWWWRDSSPSSIWPQLSETPVKPARWSPAESVGQQWSFVVSPYTLRGLVMDWTPINFPSNVSSASDHGLNESLY